MKRNRKSRSRTDGLAVDFVRGMVNTGLLAAIQDRKSRPGGGVALRRALRFALQGGLTLAAGSAAAEAAGRRDWKGAAVAVAAGALGALALEQLLTDDIDKEIPDGQEER